MKRIAALSAIAALGWTVSAAAQVVAFGSGPAGNFNYSAAAAIAQLANNKAGMQARVQPFGGSSTYVPMMDRGELDFATLNAIEMTSALTGADTFEGRKNENLRVVSVLLPFPAAFFVRKDAAVRTMADLKGKTLPGGYASQTTLIPLTTAMLANGGVTWNDVKMVPVPNNGKAADDFATGRLDGFMFAFGAGKVKEADAAVGGVRAVPLVNTPEAIAAMQKVVPQSYPVTIQPAPHLTGVMEPGTFMAYDLLWVTSTNTSEEIVYKLTKAMHDNPDALAASFASLREFAPGKMAKKLDPAQFHPGAVKFYREAGQWPPKG